MKDKVNNFLNEEINNINRKNIITVLLIMLVYGIITFINLGSFKGINTYYKASKNSSITLKANDNNLYKMCYYTGNNNASFKLYFNDSEEEIYFGDSNSKGAFSWNDIILNSNDIEKIRIEFTSDSTLGEIVLYDYDNNIINYETKAKNLKDESKNVPKELSYMNTTYFDEVYFARTAYEYVYNLNIYEWTHPPLGKIIQAIPLYITHNFSPFNYRLMSNISGILIVGVMYIMGAILFKKRKYAILASLIMSLDTFHFVHTRMGTADPHLVLFILLANMFMIIFTNTDKFKYLLLSGIFFALSISIKWTGMYGGIALAVIYFTHIIKNKTINKNHFIKGTLYFVIIPVIIYVSTFLIFSNNYIKTNNLKNVIEQNKIMYNYHSNLNAEHFFSSKWYTWPVSYKPVWLHEQNYDDNTKETISNVGNIVLWIGGLIGLVYSLYKCIRKKDKVSFYILVTVASLWLPYMFIGRIMFLYHYYPVLPFVFLALVNFLKDIDENKKYKAVVPTLLVLSLIFFILYYPVVSGKRERIEYIDNLKIFESWYF